MRRPDLVAEMKTLGGDVVLVGASSVLCTSRSAGLQLTPTPIPIAAAILLSAVSRTGRVPKTWSRCCSRIKIGSLTDGVRDRRSELVSVQPGNV